MTAARQGKAWQGDLINAYVHVGDPKYGTLNDVEIFYPRLSFDSSRLVKLLSPRPEGERLMKITEVEISEMDQITEAAQ